MDWKEKITCHLAWRCQSTWRVSMCARAPLVDILMEGEFKIFPLLLESGAIWFNDQVTTKHNKKKNITWVQDQELPPSPVKQNIINQSPLILANQNSCVEIKRLWTLTLPSTSSFMTTAGGSSTPSVCGSLNTNSLTIWPWQAFIIHTMFWTVPSRPPRKDNHVDPTRYYCRSFPGAFIFGV